MCRVDDSPDSFLASDATHLLPRQKYTGIGRDGVNDSNDLVLLLCRISVVAWGKRRDVRELYIRIQLLGLLDLRTEELNNFSMREREVVDDGERAGSRLFGPIGKVTDRVGNRAISRGCCEVPYEL